MKRIFVLLLMVMFFIACDGGSDPVDLPDPNYNFSGTWSGSITGASVASSYTMTATQNENSIAGTLINNAGFTFSITGSAYGDNISLTGIDITNSTYRIICTGTCDGFYASGTWSDSVGQSGTWYGNKE